MGRGAIAMGSVCSTTDQDVIQSKVYTKALKEQKAEDEHIKKLLLLGAGESGIFLVIFVRFH